MKFLFNKKGKANSERKAIVIASATARFFQHLQKGWANWMQKRTASFSSHHWIVTLFLFVLLSGGYSGYLFVNGFIYKVNAFEITPIRTPAHVTEDGDMPRMPVDSIAFKESDLHFRKQQGRSY